MVIGVKTYTTLLSHPELIKDEQVSDLRSIIKKFPYFQSARALYLRSLKNQDSFRYNNELKITAAYTTDRAVLFDFITSSQIEPRERFILLTNGYNYQRKSLLPERKKNH